MNAQQLKNAILQEAIEGRLMPQDPNDEPASALLARIRKEKEELVKAGKLKKKDLEVKPISEDEIPFEIPEGWEWVRWGELGEYKKGPFGSSLTKSMFVPQSDEAVKVYEQKNAIQKNYSLGDYYITKEKYETMAGFTVRPGDIIVSCAGTIGETYLLPPEAPVGIINQALMRAKLHMDSIIPYWLLHFQYVLLIENKLKGSGSAIKNIPPFEVLKAMPVPLPPLAEQHRIVAKIEELLPKVEEYGKAQDALNKLNAELPERLKKSILQEAISGRLVPQDPNDEPASVLLAKIRKEKEQLVKEGKLKKKDLEVKPISEDEIPFEIPERWEWVRLGEIISYQNGYSYNSSETNKERKGLPVIKSGNIMTLDVVVKPNNDYVENPTDRMLASKIVKGDMLMCLSSQSDNPEPLGKTAIYKDDGYALLNQRVLKFRPIADNLSSYLYYAINSFYFWYNVSHQGGGSAQANLKLYHVLDMLLPLPPLAEQHRIVEKLEQVLGGIDKLKK